MRRSYILFGVLRAGSVSSVRSLQNKLIGKYCVHLLLILSVSCSTHESSSEIHFNCSNNFDSGILTKYQDGLTLVRNNSNYRIHKCKAFA